MGQEEDLLVAKEHLHSLIDGHLLLVSQCHQSTQIVNLTLNQAIHCPEDGVQVWYPHPAPTEAAIDLFSKPKFVCDVLSLNEFPWQSSPQVRDAYRRQALLWPYDRMTVRIKLPSYDNSLGDTRQTTSPPATLSD